MDYKIYDFFNKPPTKGIVCKGIGAQQHFKEQCDLNAIIRRYPDGVPPPATMPTYGDFSSIGHGLQEYAEKFDFVQQWFASLPSQVRAQFENDPLKAQQFVVANPAGAVKLGILSLKETPKAASAASTGAEKGAAAEPPKAAIATNPSPEGVTA